MGYFQKINALRFIHGVVDYLINPWKFGTQGASRLGEKREHNHI